MMQFHAHPKFAVLLQIIWIGSMCGTLADTHVYRSFQSTIYCNASSEIQTPKNAAALVALVQSAIQNGQTVKAFGARHSATDVICTDGIPISMENIDHAHINPDGTVTFGAGIQLFTAMEFLENNDLSLIHLPTYAGISIGGAIGTGAHGSTLRHPASISDQVIRLTTILGNGSLVEVSGAELDLFRVNLGLLGIIVDATLETVPLFKMNIENRLENDHVLFDGSIPKIPAEYDMYQMWWFPQSSRVVIGTGNYTSVEAPGSAHTTLIPEASKLTISAGSLTFEALQDAGSTGALNNLADITESSLYKRVVGKPPIYTENGFSVVNPATGYAWRLQSNICKRSIFSTCGWDNGDRKNSIYPEESAMAFDISNFTGVFKMMKEIINSHKASFPLVGIYIRFQKASQSLMANAHGRTTFSVEWASPMRHDPFKNARDSIGTYQAILQEMVINYNGRPHWGKNGLYYFSENILSRAVPNRELFQNAMKSYDPKGIFLNAFGRRMLGISNTQDRDPLAIHCALQDYCTCVTNDDCAPGQACSQINGFPACGAENAEAEDVPGEIHT